MEAQNNLEILQNLTKYAQVLQHDCALFFSGDQRLAVQQRKYLIDQSIKLIESSLNLVKKNLSADTDNLN